MAPNGAKSYATALLDSLDFLSEQSIAAPLAAKSSRSLTRRMAMLKNRTWTTRLTFGRLMFLLTVAAVPTALAFGQRPPEATNKAPQVAGPSGPSDQPAVERRAVNRSVKDFAERTDLSTPETAQAAWSRASARMDDQAILELSWIKWGPRDIEDMVRYRKDNPKDTAIYNEAERNAEILEVATYRGDFAEVITRLQFPEGVGSNHPL
jgi:hypothetical protein